MLNLTPFEETTSFKKAMQKILQEDRQKDRIELLIKQVRRKYRSARSTLMKLDANLRQLSLKDLEDLFVEIVDMVSLREINARAKVNTQNHVPTNPSQLANL